MYTLRERIKLLLIKRLFSFNFPLTLFEDIIVIYDNIQKVLRMKNKYEDEYGIINLTGKKTDPNIFTKKLDKIAKRLQIKMKNKEKQKKEYRTFKDEDGWITTAIDTSLDNPYEPNTKVYEFEGKKYIFDGTSGETTLWYDFQNMHKITENLASGAIGCNVEEGWVVVPVYDLDDHEKDVGKVMDKIELVTNLVNAGFKVCVCCQAGINRSNTILIGTLMNLDTSGTKVKHLWNKYYAKVRKVVSYAYSFPEIKGSCKIAVQRLKYGESAQPLQTIPHYAYLSKDFYPLRRPWKQLEKK